MNAHGAAAAASFGALPREFYDALAASDEEAEEARFDGNAERYAAKVRSQVRR